MAEKLVFNPFTGKLDLVLKEDTIDHNSLTNTHNLTTDISHDSIADVSADDHHNESHTITSHSDIVDATGAQVEELTGGGDTTLHDHNGISENTAARHTEAHTVVSHSDTTATGAELDTLTDNSIANTLHRHSELVASDGSPDPAVSVDGDGIVSMPYQSGCRVRLTSNQIIATYTWTKLTFGTEDFDIQGEFDNTTNHRFTAKVAGYYQVNLNGYVLPTADGNWIAAAIYKNGVKVAEGSLSPIGSFQASSSVVSDIIYLNGSTDYLEGWMYHTHGANLDAPALIYANFMSIMKIA